MRRGREFTVTDEDVAAFSRAMADRAAEGPPPAPAYDVLLAKAQKNDADEVLRLILEEGFPPSHGNCVGQTALHIAAMWGAVESLEILIEAGADVNAQNQIAKMTPLHCAIQGAFTSAEETHARRLRCAELLLAAGADRKLQTKREEDAFAIADKVLEEAKDEAATARAEEMIAVLESVQESPLKRCIEELDHEGVAGCLSGAGVALAEATEGLQAVVEKFGALVEEDDASDDAYCDAYEAARGIVALLLAAGAAAAAPPGAKPQEAPLHVLCAAVAAAHGRTRAAELPAAVAAAAAVRDLRARGAAAGAATAALLPMAAHRGSAGAVRFLLDAAGVDPNAAGRQGMTALHLAARGGKAEIVRLLLATERLDPDVKDNAGKTALDYATFNKKEEIVRLLQEARGKC